MLSGYVVHPSTSLVIIRNESTPNSLIYLGSLNVPDFQVTIRNIMTSSILISTIPQAIFQDGRNQVFLNQPYANVTVALRNSTTWELLNSSGLPPAESAANLNTLITSTAFIRFPNVQQKIASTILVNNLATVTNLDFPGDFIFPEISTLGEITFLSSFYVQDNVFLGSNLYVSGTTTIGNSIAINFLNPTKVPISIQESLNIGGNLFVGGTLNILDSLVTNSSFVANTLQVQDSTISGLLSGDLDVEKSVLVRSNFFVEEEAQFQTLLVDGSISSFSNVTVGGWIEVEETTTVEKNLSSFASVFFGDNLSVGGSLYASSLIVKNELILLDNLSVQTLFTSTLIVKETTSTLSFFGGNMIVFNGISSVNFETLASSEKNDIQNGTFSVANLLSSFEMNIGESIFVGGASEFQQLSEVSSINIGGDFLIGTDLLIGKAGLAKNVFVASNLQANSLDVQGFVDVSDNILVRGDLSVLGNTSIQGQYFASSFMFDKVNVLESNDTAINATVFNTSNLISPQILVSSFLSDFLPPSAEVFLETNLTLFAQSTFIKDTVVPKSATFKNVFTSEINVGKGDISQSPSSNFNVFYPSMFEQGFSSLFLSSATIFASSIHASYIGDGSDIINANITIANLSANSLQAQSISTNFTEVSSAQITNLTLTEYATISSLLFSNLSIYPHGVLSQTNPNFITTSADTSTLIINNSIYIDRQTENVGMFLSSPQFDLDVSGIVVCAGFVFSSFAHLSIIAQNISIDGIKSASSFTVRDDYIVLSPGVLSPFLDGSVPLQVDDDLSILIVPSTITLGQQNEGNYLFSSAEKDRFILSLNSFYIFGKENSAHVGFLSKEGFRMPPAKTFIVERDVSAYSTITSTFHTEEITAPSFQSPFLEINQSRTYNQIMSGEGSILMNDSLFIDRTTQRVGIQTNDPQAELHVSGHAFFSNILSSRMEASSLSYGIAYL
jgi:predicted acyltransferase (DUF342 family)